MKLKRIAAFVMAALFLFVSIPLNADAATVKVTGVKLSNTSLTLYVGGATASLKATVSPAKATNKKVTWTSSKAKVATVDKNGVVKPLSAGTTVITVKTVDGGKKATCNVTVKPKIAVKSITLSKTTLTFNVGGAAQKLTATLNPTTATIKTVTWTTSNKAVATVDSTGTVKPGVAGTATITVKADGGKSASCKVTVYQNAAVPSITKDLSTNPVSYEFNATVYLNATATVKDGGKLSYQWYKNTQSSTIGAIAMSGQTAAIMQPPTNVAGITYYYCVVKNTNSKVNGIKTVTKTTSIANILVKPIPTIDADVPSITKDLSTVQATYTVDETAVDLVVSATVKAGTLSYQWYKNTKNSTVGATAIAGQTAAIMKLPTNVSGISYYYCVVKNTNIKVNGKTTATKTTSIANILVKKPIDASVPSIKKDIVSKIYTIDDKAEDLVVTATVTTGTLSYQWYKNSTNSTTNATLITGQTTAKYTPIINVVGTTYYYCKITNTNSAATGTKTATQYTSVVAITVNSKVDALAPSITKDLSTKPVSYAIGATAVDLEVTATVKPGTLSYQWYQNTTNSATGGTILTGKTTATLKPDTKTLGTTYYYCEITNTNSAATGTKTATTKSIVATIIVYDPNFYENADSGYSITLSHVLGVTFAVITLDPEINSDVTSITVNGVSAVQQTSNTNEWRASWTGESSPAMDIQVDIIENFYNNVESGYSITLSHILGVTFAVITLDTEINSEVTSVTVNDVSAVQQTSKSNEWRVSWIGETPSANEILVDIIK